MHTVSLSCQSWFRAARSLSIAVCVLLATACGESASNTPDADTGSTSNNTAGTSNSTTATSNGTTARHPNLPEQITDAAYCGQCHTAHYDDWDGSMHAYATQDPVFLAMLTKGLIETDGKLDQFCIQCHAPVASKFDLTPVAADESDGLWKMQLDMQDPLVSGGVVCVTCHAMGEITATLNAGFELDPHTLYGPNPVSAEALEAHPIAQGNFLKESTMCGTCHNVVNPKGALLENTFSEWYSSEFNSGGPNDKSCQDCHMPATRGPIVDGGPETDIHRHNFIGVDVALIDDFPDKEEQFRLVTELLQSCALVEVIRTEDHDGAYAFRVSVTNINNGHALPSGSTADRQVWIHLIITDDASGQVIFESGMLDENGDLMDRVPGHSTNPEGDPDLLLFGSLLFDEMGDHVNFPWEASRSQDFLIQPGQTSWREYLVPQNAVTGSSVTVQTVLRYRTFPPFLIRELEDEGYLERDLLPEIPIVDMVEKTQTFRF